MAWKVGEGAGAAIGIGSPEGVGIGVGVDAGVAPFPLVIQPAVKTAITRKQINALPVFTS